jgi:hypothetical protein
MYDVLLKVADDVTNLCRDQNTWNTFQGSINSNDNSSWKNDWKIMNKTEYAINNGTEF